MPLFHKACDIYVYSNILIINANYHFLYVISHPADAEASPEGRVSLGQGLLTVQAPTSHSDTLTHSVGLLWTSDQSGAPDNTQHS
jgi:hypothetical protein